MKRAEFDPYKLNPDFDMSSRMTDEELIQIQSGQIMVDLSLAPTPIELPFDDDEPRPMIIATSFNVPYFVGKNLTVDEILQSIQIPPIKPVEEQ